MSIADVLDQNTRDTLAHCEKLRIEYGLEPVKAFLALAQGEQPTEFLRHRIVNSGISILLRLDEHGKLCLLPGYLLATKQITIRDRRCVIRSASP